MNKQQSMEGVERKNQNENSIVIFLSHREIQNSII